MADPTRQNRIAILIPAAGLSSRMQGKDKLSLPFDNKTLLSLAVKKAMASSASEIVVVTRKTQQERIESIADLAIKLVHPETPQNEMSVSIITGLNALHPSIEGVLIVLPDMPLIEVFDINVLIEKFHPNMILRATNQKGEPGHPVLFPRKYFSEIKLIKGDNGPREVIDRHKNSLKPVPLSHNKAMMDVDTPDSWNRWLSDYNAGAGEGT